MPKHCGTLDERVGYRRLLRKWGAAAQDHCFAAVPSCGCQTRKDDECDAKASGRSHDAATTAIAAVPGRNPPGALRVSPALRSAVSRRLNRNLPRNRPLGSAARGHLLRWEFSP